jgi:hypothetical protein
MQYFSAKTCMFVAQRLGLELAHLESVGFPDLEGVKPRTESGGRAGLAGRLLRRLTGLAPFEAAAGIMSALMRASPPPARLGSYHLFCILRKPEPITHPPER